VREIYERYNITPIYNIPYSPDFNGIESYFSLVKREYKLLLLQQLMKEQKIVAEDLIRHSVSIISDDKVKRCVTSGLSFVEK
jgi:hypothetical protein